MHSDVSWSFLWLNIPPVLPSLKILIIIKKLWSNNSWIQNKVPVVRWLPLITINKRYFLVNESQQPSYHSPFPSSAVPLLPCCILVRYRHHHFDVVVGEVSWLSMQGALEPVLIDLTDQGDDVTLTEAQLTFVLWIEVIQGFTAWLSCRKER